MFLWHKYSEDREWACTTELQKNFGIIGQDWCQRIVPQLGRKTQGQAAEDLFGDGDGLHEEVLQKNADYL